MIEKLVTSVEVSKKLKKLGVLQKGCYYWVKIGGRYCIVTASLHEPLKNEYYAFTCTELAAMQNHSDCESNPDNEAYEIIEKLIKWPDYIIDINFSIKSFWEKK